MRRFQTRRTKPMRNTILLSTLISLIACAPPAIGLDDETARACVRISLGWCDDANTSQDAGRHTGEVVRRRQQKI